MANSIGLNNVPKHIVYCSINMFQSIMWHSQFNLFYCCKRFSMYISYQIHSVSVILWNKHKMVFWGFLWRIGNLMLYLFKPQLCIKFLFLLPKFICNFPLKKAYLRNSSSLDRKGRDGNIKKMITQRVWSLFRCYMMKTPGVLGVDVSPSLYPLYHMLGGGVGVINRFL